MTLRGSSGFLIGLFLVAALFGCDRAAQSQTGGNELRYDRFLSQTELTVSAVAGGWESFPPQIECTPLRDGPPFVQTIEDALAFIASKIDAKLHREALSFLEDGIHYKRTKQGTEIRYSAYFKDKSIYLFDNLFVYGCLEDVVSTLLHEMVHAVQMARFLEPGFQQGEYDLNNLGKESIIYEMWAELYQIYVSQKLALVGEDHAEKIISSHASRRMKFAAIQSDFPIN